MLKSFFSLPKINPKHIALILATSALLLVSFYAFSFIVKEDLLKQFDFNMTVRIQDKIPLKLDPYLSILSLIGSFEPLIIVLVLISIFFIRKIWSAIIIGMFLFMHVVELIGKAFLTHPGTPFLFHRYDIPFLFPTSYVQPGFSYPSGHAMRTMFLVVIGIYLLSKTKKISQNIKIISVLSIIILAIIMLVSRVSLGEHWTTDVIGGGILGSAFGILSLLFI